jgi:signal transduction histidine kinase
VEPPAPTARPAGLSLERKLPLLITALLVVTLAAGAAFGHREVKRSAVDAARERLKLITRQLASLSATPLALRRATLATTAGDSAFSAFLSAPTAAARETAREALGRLRTPADSTVLLMVLDRARKPLLSVGPMPAGAAAGGAGLPPGAAAFPDSTGGYGRFMAIGRKPYFWNVAPVRRGGATLGYVAELRSVGSATSARQVQALFGDSIELYYGNTAGGEWIGLDASLVRAPRAWPFTGPARYHRRGIDHFAHADTIPGTPWSYVAEEPLPAVLERPDAFLRRAALGALALCLAGAAVAWLLSRTITRPVKALGVAADAIARGDYARRIDLRRQDELGVLAAHFDSMAEQVQATHEELSEQYETAQSLAEELEQANQELELALGEADTARHDAESANRAKSDFLATMSHEIRTPINAIVGYAELLELGLSGPVTPAQMAQLERVRVSGRHLIGLVDQVLDFARIESGTLRVERRVASAAEAVETTLTVLRPQAEKKGVALTESLDDAGGLRYLGDPQRVEQILVNVLSNAIKFTEAGGRATFTGARVEGASPGLGRVGRWVCVTVEDTGAGIEPGELERIFEPFVQVDSGYTRRHEGTGLGLAISLRLARSMFGELSVESEPGRGSRFTLWLPAADGAGDA